MEKVLFEKPNFDELLKNHTVVDMHSHTEASHDCTNSIKQFAEKIRSMKIGVAVTDHDEIRGSLTLKKKYPKLFQVPGIEVTSRENKHILFYFNKHSDLETFYTKHIHVNKKKHRTNAFRIRTILKTEYLLDIAKDYNAYRVFAHPMIASEGIYNSMLKSKDFSLVKKIDGIEVVNSTQSLKANVRSWAWANLEKKGFTGGSDSHIIKTLGTTVTVANGSTTEDFVEELRKKKNGVIGHTNPWTTEMNMIRTIMKNKLKWSRN